MNPHVSVVIPTYYRNEILTHTLRSISQQTYQGDIEVVVVDDSGEENARKVVEPTDAVYIPFTENRGPAAARDHGIRVASGDLVHLLDDDDFLLENAIEDLVEKYQSSAAGVVYGGLQTDSQRVLPNPAVQGDVLEEALGFNMAPCIPSTMLCGTKHLTNLPPLDELPSDDHAFQIELAKRTEFDYVSKPVIKRGKYDTSRGATRDMVKRRFETISYYDELYEANPAARREALGYSYLLDAHTKLNQEMWSLDAITSAAKSAVWLQNPVMYGYVASTILGRPGRDLAQRVYMRLMQEDERQGKFV